MLAGQPARMVYFDDPSPPGPGGSPDQLYSMLPSNVDGAAPPVGAPNYFVQSDDDGLGYPQDQLEVWAFHVDWGNPFASTFTQASLLATAAFNSDLCAFAFTANCIPQSNTSVGVDGISDRLMYRLQYRNFGSYQTLVVCQTVNVGTNSYPSSGGRAAIRWYELHYSGVGWTIFQQGTYSPNSANRWMVSIAMDHRHGP